MSENGIKELKIGFGMERMPCGQFQANAADLLRAHKADVELFVRDTETALLAIQIE